MVSQDPVSVRFGPPPRVLVAGLGNICQCDDGFGVEVARALVARQSWPEHVRVADFGVRGSDIVAELLGQRYDLAVFVDAVSRGGRPGTVYINEHDQSRQASAQPAGDLGDLTPDAIVSLLTKLGGVPPRIIIVGCEPARLERGVGLSDPVLNAVSAAVSTVVGIIHESSAAPGKTAVLR